MRPNPGDKRGFATKPALARALMARAVEAKVPSAWAAGDEVYGADPALHAAIRGHGLGYVLAVSANRRMPTAAGPIRVDRIPALLPKRGLAEHSAGAGSHGHRLYSWAWIALLPEDDTDTGYHHLLIRRNDATGEQDLPALLRTAPGHPAHPRHRRGAALAHRGVLPDRQGPDRAGPPPGPALGLLAPLDHRGHARPLLHGRGHRRRT